MSRGSRVESCWMRVGDEVWKGRLDEARGVLSAAEDSYQPQYDITYTIISPNAHRDASKPFKFQHTRLTVFTANHATHQIEPRLTIQENHCAPCDLSSGRKYRMPSDESPCLQKRRRTFLSVIVLDSKPTIE